MKAYFKIIWCILLFLPLSKIVTAQTNYVKTGYFTQVYAREHITDMPREFFLLFEADGTETVLSFSQQRSSGIYSVWQFDPKDFLGKTISIDIDATVDNQNNEFNYWEGATLVKVPKLSIKKINSFVEAGSTITAPTEYQHPQTDTILMPHKILIPEEIYADKTPSTKIVQLTDYIQGDGTEVSPYTSTDGTAGLKSAIANLPDGGTVEIAPGIYRATARNLNIPRFVSLKGVGASKPKFYMNTDRMWSLKGNNTIDNINLDVTQNTRNYTHEVARIDNNARDITISNSEFISNYTVTISENSTEETGNVVFFRFYSHIKNVTFLNNTFIKPLRPIAIKGQKNIHNLTFKGNRFEGQCNMCITLDQISNMSNVIIEENDFIEFSHFGIALARTNDVTIRNNTFYSRNLESFNTYNQALHIEEHAQNLIIENNDIDVTLRTTGFGDPTSTVRSFGMILLDSRLMTIKDNNVKHADIFFTSTKTNATAGFTSMTKNTLEDGAIRIKDGHEKISIKNNIITNPPIYGIQLESVKPIQYPFGKHNIEFNEFNEMDNKQAFRIKGEVKEVSINNNTFKGCNQKINDIDLFDNATALTIKDNQFYGLTPGNAFNVKGNLPAGNSLSQYNSENIINEDCTLSIDSVTSEKLAYLYPNPAKTGDEITILDTDNNSSSFSIYDLKGLLIISEIGNKINTEGLAPGVYIITTQIGSKENNSKLIITP